MTERKHPKAKCEECPLRESGAYVPTLFGTGNIGVVGKAPGEHEARSGIPFTGRSGEILDKVLGHYGYSRREVTYANIVACSLSDPNESPPKTAVAACSERLEADLAASRAHLWLGLGKDGASALLGKKQPISEARIGPPKETKYGLVIPTWHSAYCLRYPDAFPSFVHDVGKIHADNLPDLWSEPKYVVILDPAKAVIAMQRLQQFPRIVIDIEAATDKDFDDSHPEDYEMLCIGIGFAPKSVMVFDGNVFNYPEVIEEFSKLLDVAEVEGWNLKFDLKGTSPLVGFKNASRDGMLMSYCLDERPRQHGLKVRSVEDLGSPKYDEEIEQYTKGKHGSFAKIPKDLLYKYNAYDVSCTWDEIDILWNKMDHRKRGLHNFLIEASNMLMEVEMVKFRFDLDYNKELEIEYNELIRESKGKIQAHVGYPINPNSPQQVMKYFGENGYLIEHTEKQYLEEILNKGQLDDDANTFIRLLLSHRKLVKLLGTYIIGIRKKLTADGRAGTTFLLHGTTSGRLASRNPNLQNLPRFDKIRNQFTADPGKVLVHVDYSQIEFRIIATLGQIPYLQKIFSDPNVDVFNDICDQIWGKGRWNKENRVSIKSVIYGLSYGRKEKSISQEIDKSVTYVKELMLQFRRLMPELFEWQRSIKRRVLNGEDLYAPFGRTRSFHLIVEDNQDSVLNEALSYMPQSIASDICLRAAIRLHPVLKERFGAQIKLLIHDAVVVECEPHLVEQVKSTMIEYMEQSGREFTDYVPFHCEATHAYRLGEL